MNGLKCLYAPGGQNGVFQSIMHASVLSALGNSPISATGLVELKGERHKGFHYTNVYKQRGYIYTCMCKCYSLYIYHSALYFSLKLCKGFSSTSLKPSLYGLLYCHRLGLSVIIKHTEQTFT